MSLENQQWHCYFGDMNKCNIYIYIYILIDLNNNCTFDFFMRAYVQMC